MELAMSKDDYDALTDEAHEARLRWVGGRFNYKPMVIGHTRMKTQSGTGERS